MSESLAPGLYVVRNSQMIQCRCCGEIHDFFTAAYSRPEGGYKPCRPALLPHDTIRHNGLDKWGMVEPAGGMTVLGHLINCPPLLKTAGLIHAN